MNEGHASFAMIERARTFMEESRQSFDVALAATRAGNIFTTHTPVEAGFDRFVPAVIEQYLGAYARDKLGISLYDLLALGRRDPQDASEPFSMPYLAVRGSGAINGVGRLHGGVSRRIFQPLFPRWPQSEVPIGYVTNGVHMPTWDSPEADDLWTSACGKSRWLGTLETLGRDIQYLTDERLWQFRADARKSLINFARARLAQQQASHGASLEEAAWAHHLFNHDTLTIGFARRFATYKRPNLLLRDPDRLLRILTNPARPAQLLVAGKAHPADEFPWLRVKTSRSFTPGAPDGESG